MFLIIEGCSSTVLFSSNIEKKYNLIKEDLKNVQFYLENEFSLEREITLIDSKKIAPSHTLKTEEGRLIEEIYFAKDLPGVMLKSNGDTLFVSFEDYKTIPFCNQNTSDGVYVMAIQNTQVGKTRDPWKVSDISTNMRFLNYDSDIYKIVFQKKPRSLVKEENLSSIDRKKRDAKGILLGE